MKPFSISGRLHGLVQFLLLSLIGYSSFAGTTGKIAGKVTDARTGEPMIGANVVIRGTRMGTITDQNGAYFIINVHPGKICGHDFLHRLRECDQNRGGG